MKPQKKMRPELGGLDWKPRKQIYEGCNGKCSFDPETFVGKSYGYWNVVEKIKGKVVFNSYTYSMTTSGHQGTLSYVLKQLKKAPLIEVQCSGGLQRFREQALEPEYTRLIRAQLSLKTCRADKVAEHKQTIKVQTKRIKTIKALGAVFNSVQVKRLKELIEAKIAQEKHWAKERRRLDAEKRAAKKQTETQLLSVGTVDLEKTFKDLEAC